MKFIKPFETFNFKIKESTDAQTEFSPYDELRAYWKKKKYGLRNLDSHVIDRSSRRPSINRYALRSLYIQACIEEPSMLRDNNWQYILENMTGYDFSGEACMPLVKRIIETYKPSTELIKKAVRNLIEAFRIEGSFEDQFKKVSKLPKRTGTDIPAANYLIELLPNNDLIDLIKECVRGRYTSDMHCCNWLVYNGYITCKKNVPRTYHADANLGLQFLRSRDAEYSGWQILKDPDCEFTEYFFTTIIKHPNNGGLNKHDAQFSRIVYQLYFIPAFKKYLEENPDKEPYFEKIYNKLFHNHEEA
jgi:hypothetical protein